MVLPRGGRKHPITRASSALHTLFICMQPNIHSVSLMSSDVLWIQLLLTYMNTAGKLSLLLFLLQMNKYFFYCSVTTVRSADSHSSPHPDPRPVSTDLRRPPSAGRRGVPYGPQTEPAASWTTRSPGQNR